MNSRHRILLGGALLAAAGFATLSYHKADAAIAAPFSSIDYPASALPPGVTGVVSTEVWGVNNLGDMVGTYGDTNGLFHGFVYRNGNFSTVDGPTGAGGDIAVFTQIRSINDYGDIAGLFIPYSAVAGQTPGGGFRGLYQKNGGTLTVYQMPGHLNTIFNRITNEELIYGCFHDDGVDTGPQDSMFGIAGPIAQWPDVQVITDTASAQGTPGSTMNVGGNPYGTLFTGVFYDHSDGQALSAGDVPGRHRAYIIQQSQLQTGAANSQSVQLQRTNFDVPGSNNTSSWDMDIVGNVVGIWGLQQDTATGNYHGFLRQINGNFLDIEFPNSVDTEPLGINDSGSIVGSYIDAAGNEHGFLTWSWFLGANPSNIMGPASLMALILPTPGRASLHGPFGGDAAVSNREGFSPARIGMVKTIPHDLPLQAAAHTGMACCHRHPNMKMTMPK